ncbi:MAG: NADH:flavin oxidoreductase/NADH oxidase family protein [Desulfobacula sp.]|nr:NADH:flavin oxidoreductase/NADH oxidase family protein [Desulfobacula sp.]
MSEQLGDKAHNPTQGLARLYAIWADGGTGLSMTGNVMVDRSALGEPKNVVLDNKSDKSLFQAWTEAGKKKDAQLWVQLNHPGKQTPSFLTKKPVAPSAIPLGKGLDKVFNLPIELSEDDIWKIIKKFGVSAGLAKDVGFSGVQIHGAHGFLVSQFLSPHHNQRTDQWGGTLENRSRFVLEVFREMRKAVGENFPVGIKMNSADFMKSGFTTEDSVEVAKALEEEGIDLIEISGGTYESPSMMGNRTKASTKKREAYFLEYAEKLKKQIDVPIVVTGGFRSGSAMQDALESGRTDMIGLARPLAIEPDFPNKLLNDTDAQSTLEDPTTGFAYIDKMTMLSITWYEYQLAKLANGKKVNPNQNAWSAVFQTLVRLGVHGFLRRRA